MSSVRKIKTVSKSKPTIEGAGVHLKRAFGYYQVPQFDPFLMLDDFRSDDPCKIPPRLSLASASRHRDHHVRDRGGRGAWGQHGE